jgi:chromate transporter
MSDGIANTSPSLVKMFRTFFWTGLTGFGGLAMTAYIRRQIVEKKQWLDEDSFDSGLALCQMIPGAIVMQLAAYIGLKTRGIKGAVVSFIGFGLPAFLIMFILSVLYKHSKNISGVETILAGLRVIVVAIVAYAAWVFGRKNIRNITDIVVVLLAAGAFFIKLHPVLVLIIAVLGQFLLSGKAEISTLIPVKTNTFRFFIRIILAVVICCTVLYFISYPYFLLATVMLRIDLYSFGGGLAAMPIMYHELVDMFHWFDEQTFMDGIVLGQVTPGSIIIAATFFGYLHLGILGSMLATISVFTPSFVILMGIGPYFDRLATHKWFKKVIDGILCSFIGLLLIITYRFSVGIHWNLQSILIVLLAFLLLLRKAEVIWVVLGGVLFAIIKSHV